MELPAMHPILLLFMLLVFGVIQVKPITASANFGNYNISDRMSAGSNDFKEKYGDKVFSVFSLHSGSKKVIKNKEVIL